jgi:integrase
MLSYGPNVAQLYIDPPPLLPRIDMARRKINRRKSSGYLNIDSIVESVASTGDRRIYAVKKVLRILEEVTGKGYKEAITDIVKGKMDAYETIRAFLAKMQEEKLAPKTLKFYLHLLIRMLRMAGAEIRSDILRYRIVLPPTRAVRADRAPTIDELRKILSVMGLRNKALFLTLASTGMRLIECLQLKVSDLHMESDPPYVDVRTAKTGIVRRVYLTKECVDTLREYLSDRERNNIRSEWLWPRKGDPDKFLRKVHAQQYWYSAIKKVGMDYKDSSGGYQLHIHSLRKFYRTQLERAGVSRTTISLWMGQVTGLDLSYFRPSEPELIEEWRKAEPFLTIYKAESPEKIKNEAVIEAIRRFAVMMGIDPMRIRIEKERELGRKLTEEEELKIIENEMKKMREGSGDPKKIVREEDLERYLREGWDIYTILPSGKIVIRRTV